MQQSAKRTEEPRGRTRRDYRRKRLPKSELNIDWAKSNIEITERRQRILDILKTHRLMTIEQLEYLHPDYGHQSQSRLLLRRDINKLHEVYLVDKAIKKPIAQWDGSIKKTTVIAMGELGSYLVGWAKYHKRISYQDGTTTLPTTAHHTIRIHDMEIQVRELMKTLDVDVKAWAYECGNRIVQHSNGLNPDSFCMLHDKVTGKYYTLWIEYDTGKMDFRRRTKFPELAPKFDRYREIKNWSGWYEKAISRASQNKFPHLFFVTEDQSRFPGVPDLLRERGLDNTVCMQQDFLSEMEKFIQKMRGEKA